MLRKKAVQWHRLEALESGTVIVEFKDGAYVPTGEGDVVIAFSMCLWYVIS